MEGGGEGEGAEAAEAAEAAEEVEVESTRSGFLRVLILLSSESPMLAKLASLLSSVSWRRREGLRGTEVEDMGERGMEREGGRKEGRKEGKGRERGDRGRMSRDV